MNFNESKLPDHIIKIDRGYNTTCFVSLYGATIVSWKIRGEEQLFFSKKSHLDGKTAPIGGIQIVFPHFEKQLDENSPPDNGFAQTLKWTVHQAPLRLASGNMEAIFVLSPSDATKSVCLCDFILFYRVYLRKDALDCHLNVENTSSAPLTCELLLSTHFLVDSFLTFSLLGLFKCLYTDRMAENMMHMEKSEEIAVNSSMDRLYRLTPIEQLLKFNCLRWVRMCKHNLPDFVVKVYGAQAPVAEDEGKHCICLGAGILDEGATIEAGKNFEIGVDFQLVYTEE